MPLINWSTKYSVGNPSLDTQHQKLVSVINEFHDAMKAGKGKDILGKILSDLINYTEGHFRYEEKLMEDAKFPGLFAQKTEHNKLTEQVLQFSEAFRNNNTTVSIELMQFLKAWLVNHIEGMDMKYKGVI